jgi:hypothetical protein
MSTLERSHSHTPTRRDPVGVLMLSVMLATLLNVVLTGAVAAVAITAAPATAAPTDLIVSNEGGSAALNLADSAALAQQIGGVAEVSPMLSRTAQVSVGDQRIDVQVQGVAADFPRLLAWQTSQGRFLTQQDDVTLDRVAVMDAGLARQLFGPTSSAIGGSVVIRGIPFTVVGIGSNGQRQSTILVPFRTAQIRLFGATALDEIVVQVGAASPTSAVSQQVETLLRARHNLHGSQADDFSLSSVRATLSTGSQLSGELIVQTVQGFLCSAKNTCRLASSNSLNSGLGAA